MSTAKTKVSKKLVEDFLAKRGVDPNSLQIITGGELSQAFYFIDKAATKVLRVNNSRLLEGFLKDQFAFEHFSVRNLPIPEIEEIGELAEGMHYAISKRAPGETLDKFSRAEIDKLMPEIFASLET